MLKSVGDEVALIPRDNLLQYTNKEKSPMGDILYISTYDTHAQLVRSSINKAWHILQGDQTYGKLFRDKPKYIYTVRDVV